MMSFQNSGGGRRIQVDRGLGRAAYNRPTVEAVVIKGERT
jgi:hypothetical protein